MTPEFVMFLRESARGYKNGATGVDFWNNIASGVFNSEVSPESSIKSPIHHIIHWFITFYINHRRHGDKVTKLNLFFLWFIL